MTASQPRNQPNLRRRLRSLLIVGSLLLPAFCVMGWLSFLATAWVRWLIFGVWLLISVLLSLVVARTLKTLALLDQEMQE